jgi:type II restriction enzyme
MTDLLNIIRQYKQDSESVYNTWFINNEDRLKAFRSIRRGVMNVTQDIKAGTFGNDFKGSSLEFVLTCITEQKQVFEGAAHPFYWKPKLRIPDIYETEVNKVAFGQFLESCLNATKEEQLIKEIIKLSSRNIKGLGPSVANILYFLHPTILPPFNTAIVNGFNLLFNEKVKLGSWESYLRMREVMLQVNTQYRNELSTDLGAIAGLLFEIGANKLLIEGSSALDETQQSKVEKLLKKRHTEVMSEQQETDLHTEMQYHLLKIGHALGYDVVVASNDRSKAYQDHKFSFICIPCLPKMEIDRDTFNTISLIDVLWLAKGTNQVIGAFEVEKSTSIYSGILRLSDLAVSCPHDIRTLFLVVPDRREQEVIRQLKRPSIEQQQVPMQYILFADLRQYCDAICKFGADNSAMTKIAKTAS